MDSNLGASARKRFVDDEPRWRSQLRARWVVYAAVLGSIIAFQYKHISTAQPRGISFVALFLVAFSLPVVWDLLRRANERAQENRANGTSSRLANAQAIGIGTAAVALLATVSWVLAVDIVLAA